MPTATLDTPAATPAANPTPSAPPPVQPVAPPPWQEVLSAAKSNNLSLDDQRTALQAWTASTRAFLNSPAASDLKPDQKAQALDYAQKQYDSVTPGPLNVGNLVSGVKQIPGALIGTASALSGKNESATTAMVGQGLGDLQEIHSAVASRLPTENNVGRQQLDALFDELQNNAKSGTLVRDGKLNTKYLSTWGDAVKDAAAQYNGEPTKNYFYPQYDANSPENQALITKFYATLDPQALSILRNRMSQSVVSAVGDKATQAAVGQLPAGTPDYVKNNFGSGLDPIQAAMIAIPGFDELELPALADKLGAAGKVAAKAGQLGGVGAAAGAVQTVAKTPNPTASDVGKGAASGAAQFLALGGAHELASAAIGQFPGVKNARINAQLTAMGLTPEQYAKMDANTQAQAQQAAQTALDAADRLRDQGEGAGQPQTPPAQATAILNRRAAIGDVNAQQGAAPPDPLAERRQAIQDALDASHAHNSAFTPIFPDEAAQEARMSKAFQAGPEYTPTVEATAKLSDVLPRAERAGIITIADDDDRTPVQMAIDAQHALGTKRAVDAAQALEDQLGPIEQQKQSASEAALLQRKLVQQSAPKGPVSPILALEPQAAPIPAPATPSDAIDAGKAATGGGKGAEASQLPIAAPQPESLPNIVARATAPDIHIADIAAQPGMEKIPVAQKANLQVAAALRPETAPIAAPAQQGSPISTEALPSQPIPETPPTIAAQLEWLKSGKRDAVLITPGGTIPEVPEGFSSVKTKDGTFIYNPDKTDASTLRTHVKNNTVGDALGYGVPNKPAPGTDVGAVVIRGPDGVEKQTVVVDKDGIAPATKSAQAIADAGDSVKVEPIAPILRERISPNNPQSTGEPNATNPRNVEDENQLQHPRASQGAAVPENGGEVRPGQGEQAGNRGGPVGGKEKAAKPFGRPGHVTVPDFIVKGTTRIANSIERGDTVDQISANKDAANQLADVEAKRQTNDVRGALSRVFPDYYTKGKTLAREFLSRKPLLPNDALTVLMETAAKDKGEAIAKLNEQEATIRASTKADPAQAKRILAAIDFAKSNFDKLQPIAQLSDSKYDAQHQLENAKGLASPYRQGYVYHAQDIESPEGFEAPASGAGPNARFRMGRTHDTYADSVANGVKFHTLDGPDLLESRIRNGGRIVNNTAFVDGLSAIKDPINKAPLTAPITVVKRPNGPDYETVPRGYTKVDLNGRRLGIQDPYVKLVTALTNPSAFEHEQLGRLLREGSQFKKSIQTTLDSFHLGWGAWRYVTAKLGSLDNPTPPFNTLRGRLALDFSPEEARQLAASGKVPQSWLKDIDERNRISGVLVKNGLLPGRGTDALHQELVKSLPILGGSNRYVFDGFIRSAINEIATREFQVQQKMFPKLSEDQLARKVSGEVNNFMGNVGSRGIFKSKTFQDIARIATLAPGLTEGKFRSEVGAPIQAAQAIPQSIRAGRPASGLYARGTAAALVASFAAAQVLNLYFRGYPTWENKEEGHDAKVSGYIPDAIGGGPGLFYDPLEAAAPTLTQLHDIYARTGGDIGKSALQFARDKSGPLVSPLFDLSGTGPTGKPLKSGATSAALAYIPAPIAGQTGFDAAKQVVTGKHAETFPGEFERRALSSLGIRTTGVPASEQRISALAQQYKKANGIPVFTPGGDDDNPYQDLNSALRVSNTADASKAIAALLQKKTPEQVQAYFLAYPNRAFTGSNKNDQKFRATLNPEQQKAFDAAVASRTKLAQNAVNLLASQPNASKETQAVAANFPEMMQVAEVSRQQSLQRDGTKTQAQSAYDALTSAKTPQDQQAAFAAAHASPQVFSEFKSLVAQGNKTKLEGANAGLIKRIGGLGVENGERAQAVNRVLSGISPQGQSLLIQQMIAAKVLTPKVMAQINQQKAQQQQSQ